MASLKDLHSKILECTKCPLHQTRTMAVPGAGNSKAELMLVGEAPGANEDATGTPFCGKAGKVLDELLAKTGFKREYIYITNILKCRPPNNRNPKDDEIKTCTGYLDEQLELINPRIIGCLGNFATHYILKKFGLATTRQGISNIHGKVFIYQSLFKEIKVVPLYHPAVATYNANMITQISKDFIKLKDILH